MCGLIENKVEPLIDYLQDGTVTLGYANRLKNRDVVIDKLAAHRIFAPVHWLLPDEVDRNKFPESAKLADSLLTLPIDQRYGPDEMNYIADILKRVI